jgi:dTDP-glucose 4,6-dehydratase
MILVTGGAGFIGSSFVIDWLATSGEPVLNLDALTYAGSLENLACLAGDPRHVFIHGDIRDAALVRRLLAEHPIRGIVHLAAESHVDRSIDAPADFIQTNVVGTFTLLEAARDHWQALPPAEQERFRFLHVSTDEVFGALEPAEPAFTETSPSRPNSPYAASKAAADHLVRSYHRTYGLPVLTTHCSNNYGPRQFPEKLIPLCLHRALAGEPLPVYGDGRQIRDWLYVGDHVAAIRRVLEAGRPGGVYAIGGGSELANLDVVRTLCGILDTLRPRADGRSHADQITFVADRPGHDRRYAIDAGTIARELSWRPTVDFTTGIRRTIDWYLDNEAWVGRAGGGGPERLARQGRR